MPVCNRKAGARFVLFLFLNFFIPFFFSRTIRTSGRELIDSPIDSPMDALISAEC